MTLTKVLWKKIIFMLSLTLDVSVKRSEMRCQILFSLLPNFAQNTANQFHFLRELTTFCEIPRLKSSRYLLVQNPQWKYQNNLQNIFKDTLVFLLLTFNKEIPVGNN